jgi:hypothetical protein
MPIYDPDTNGGNAASMPSVHDLLQQRISEDYDPRFGTFNSDDLSKTIDNLESRYPGKGTLPDVNKNSGFLPPKYRGYYADHPDEVIDNQMLGQEMARGGKLGVMRGMKLKEPTHIPHMGGLFHSNTGGRTDNMPVSVQHNSYIIPADVVSGIGEGNSAAGGKMLDNHFGGGKSPHIGQTGAFSSGGRVPIIVAGGEYHVTPEQVKKVGRGNISHGHAILDAFVKHVRKTTIKDMKGLAPPKK